MPALFSQGALAAFTDRSEGPLALTAWAVGSPPPLLAPGYCHGRDAPATAVTTVSSRAARVQSAAPLRRSMPTGSSSRSRAKTAVTRTHRSFGFSGSRGIVDIRRNFLSESRDNSHSVKARGSIPSSQESRDADKQTSLHVPSEKLQPALPARDKSASAHRDQRGRKPSISNHALVHPPTPPPSLVSAVGTSGDAVTMATNKAVAGSRMARKQRAKTGHGAQSRAAGGRPASSLTKAAAAEAGTSATVARPPTAQQSSPLQPSGFKAAGPLDGFDSLLRGGSTIPQAFTKDGALGDRVPTSQSTRKARLMEWAKEVHKPTMTRLDHAVPANAPTPVLRTPHVNPVNRGAMAMSYKPEGRPNPRTPRAHFIIDKQWPSDELAFRQHPARYGAFRRKFELD